MIYLMIVAMGLVVFLNRYLFLEPRLPVRLNRGAREFLGFAVPACSRRSAGRSFPRRHSST
jgi:branched-subunit amino acid transport protein